MVGAPVGEGEIVIGCRRIDGGVEGVSGEAREITDIVRKVGTNNGFSRTDRGVHALKNTFHVDEKIAKKQMKPMATHPNNNKILLFKNSSNESSRTIPRNQSSKGLYNFFYSSFSCGFKLTVSSNRFAAAWRYRLVNRDRSLPGLIPMSL